MMHTMYENAAKYLVCWIVSFRKHFSETDTFFCFLLYYVERLAYMANRAKMCMFRKKFKLAKFEPF